MSTLAATDGTTKRAETFSPASSGSVHILTSASRAELACSVHMPGTPALSASSRSRHSSARTSPTRIRLGRMRRLSLTRSRSLTSPVPSNPLCRVCMATQSGWGKRSSKTSSALITRSPPGIAAARQFSSVVLPDTVARGPPEPTASQLKLKHGQRHERSGGQATHAPDSPLIWTPSGTGRDRHRKSIPSHQNTGAEGLSQDCGDLPSFGVGQPGAGEVGVIDRDGHHHDGGGGLANLGSGIVGVRPRYPDEVHSQGAAIFVQASGLLTIWVVMRQVPSLNGWSLQEVLLIYGLITLSKSINHMFADNLWTLGRQYLRTARFR